MKKKIVALSVGLGLLASSCLGVNSAPEDRSFPASHALKDWNNSVTESKWANEGLFLVCTPIYAFATLLDLLVLNSIEFWTSED